MLLSGLRSLVSGEPSTEAGRALASRRVADFELVALQAEADFAEGSFSAAFGRFREALNLSRGLPALEERVVNMAVSQAWRLLPRDWRIAESLLLEAREVDWSGRMPPELWEGIQNGEREETICKVLNATDLAFWSPEMPVEQQRRLTALAVRYPDDARLARRLWAVNLLLTNAQVDERLPASMKAGVTEAGQEAVIGPHEAVLVRRATAWQKQATETAPAWWMGRKSAEVAWIRLQTAGAVILVTAVLSMAGGLTWWHAVKSTSRPKAASRAAVQTVEIPVSKTVAPSMGPTPVTAVSPQQPIVRPAKLGGAISGAAPGEVQGRRRFDASLLEASLKKVPLPSQPGDILPPTEQPVQDTLVAAAPELPDLENIGAERAPAAIRRSEEVSPRETVEVLNVVRQYATAWNARNIESILSLQPYLNRRAVKAQLSPLRSLTMKILPLSEPSIEGGKATVRCRRQVDEVFADGVEKRGPEMTVTFVLARQSGAWTIESAKQ